MSDQTDQTPTVTDDAIRRAHEWCDLHWPTDENRTPMADVIRHYRATVPAPPATLADELRDICKKYSGDVEVDLEPLADRAEAVEKELAGRKRDYIECQEELIASEEELRETRSKRDEARAEVERLTKFHPSGRIRPGEFTKKDDTLPGLADELRDVAEHYGMSSRASERVDSLADRVEAIEKENRDMERELNNAWGERDESRAEVERMQEARERHEKMYREARAEVGRLATDLESADSAMAHVERQRDEACAEVGRLTSGRPVRESRTVDLPDPADVPRNEPWEVVGPNGPAIGYRDGHEDLPWSVVHKDGNGCDDLSDGRVTLVARLVPEVTA